MKKKTSSLILVKIVWETQKWLWFNKIVRRPMKLLKINKKYGPFHSISFKGLLLKFLKTHIKQVFFSKCFISFQTVLWSQTMSFLRDIFSFPSDFLSWNFSKIWGGTKNGRALICRWFHRTFSTFFNLVFRPPNYAAKCREIHRLKTSLGQ